MRKGTRSALVLGLLILAMAMPSVGAKTGLGLSIYDVDLFMSRGEKQVTPVMRVSNVGDSPITIRIVILSQKNGPTFKIAENDVLIAPEQSFLIEIEIVAQGPSGKYDFIVEIQGISKAVEGNAICPGGTMRGKITVEGEPGSNDSFITYGVGGIILVACGCTGFIVWRKKKEEAEDECDHA